MLFRRIQILDWFVQIAQLVPYASAMSAIAVFFLLLTAPPGSTSGQIVANPELVKMQQHLDQVVATKDWQKIRSQTDSNRERILKMLSSGELKAAQDFTTAAQLTDDPSGWFENRRIQHELTLAGLSLGDLNAAPQFTRTWDGLLISMAWGQRFATVNVPEAQPGSRYYLQPAPLAVVEVLSDPATARQKAATAKDNPEIKAIVDADQAVRQQDWMKLTQDQLLAIMKDDEARMEKVKKIVDSGALVTGNDFGSAALVLQHGREVTDYMLAHELAAAGTVLGAKDAPWLMAATYDRMMVNFGRRQRFGTQYNERGLQPIDLDGIEDAERKALHAPTLAEAKKRAEEMTKGG